MKNSGLELVFILDRSGSMYHLTADTIGGFNALLDKHREEYKGILLTTALFNDESTVVHDRVPSTQAKHMTEKDYVASGNTALYDAIGSMIKHIETIHKYARPEDVPEKTMFFIITDGMENASRHFDLEQVRGMIEEKRKLLGWEFVFFGANIDAKQVARQMYIDADRAHQFEPTRVSAFNCLSYDCDGELPF